MNRDNLVISKAQGPTWGHDKYRHFGNFGGAKPHLGRGREHNEYRHFGNFKCAKPYLGRGETREAATLW